MLRRALDKQLYRGKRKRFGGAKMVRWGAARQRRQPLHIFAFNPQRLAARCQDVDVCRTREDGRGEGGGSLDDVLAIVEHQLQPAIPERSD
jgi:hypothetical protein